MNPLNNILIVDDEAPARRKIVTFLRKLGHSIESMEAENGLQALSHLENAKIDLMFLDIHMPGMSGIEMAEQIGIANMPKTIFTTAYDQYAVKAFDMQAIDYLLKPFDLDRFEQAFKKAKGSMNDSAWVFNQELMATIFSNTQGKKDRIWVSHGGKYIPLFYEHIEYLEADGNYLMVHYQEKKYAIRKSLLQMAKELPKGQFEKTHKSYLVNTHLIEEITPKSHGDCFIKMKSGTVVPLSRQFRNKLL